LTFQSSDVVAAEVIGSLTNLTIFVPSRMERQLHDSPDGMFDVSRSRIYKTIPITTFVQFLL